MLRSEIAESHGSSIFSFLLSAPFETEENEIYQGNITYPKEVA